jgi:thiosulfate/3-mercaptopyruvate sulfurtransferase
MLIPARTMSTAMPSSPLPHPDQNPDPEALLVSAQWLQARLQQAGDPQPGQPRLRILDCSTYMTPQPVGPSKISSGRADYLAGHIPGAQHVDMALDLSDPNGAYPYTLLSPAAFEALMQRLGMDPDDQVLVYGRSAMVTLTRAWFVLHAMGHARVTVLDGGFAAWQALGGPLSQTAPHVAPNVYRARPLPSRVASLAQVRAALGQPQVCLAMP